jgi:integrase
LFRQNYPCDPPARTTILLAAIKYRNSPDMDGGAVGEEMLVKQGVRSCSAREPESTGASAGRILPIPDALLAELRAAKARQATEKLALGEAYTDLGHVECNEAGEPYHPSTLSRLWQAAIRNLAVPQVRLHDARHTCATLMLLQGVPIALVAAWLGHADVSFTLRTYVHAQPEALAVAAQSFAPPAFNAGD